MNLTPQSLPLLRRMYPNPIDYYAKVSFLALENDLITEREAKEMAAKSVKLRLRPDIAIRMLESMVVYRLRYGKTGSAHAYWQKKNDDANAQDNPLNKIKI